MGQTIATPANTVPNDGTPPSSTESLNGLFNKDCRAALDLVDELRSCGLDSIQLPQLVVCGDQSAGKSSVLEALTQVPFPTKDNLCTRFATQIVIRSGNVDTIRPRIIPDQGLSTQEQRRLGNFQQSIHDFQDVSELISKAEAHMRLHKTSSKAVVDRSKNKAFSRNILSIEIEGPGRQSLTLVDLPGWISAATAHHTEADVKLIPELIRQYIKQERTVILAVLSANSELSLQHILDECRAVDPSGQRTLGIITKPDMVPAGSDSEKDWIDVASNNVRENHLELGWHVLRNR